MPRACATTADSKHTLGTVTNRGRRALRGGPAAYVESGRWPTGAIRPDAPGATWWAAEISRRLASALAEESKSATAEATGMARSTLYDILNGTTWPDLVTLVALEEHLHVAIIPRWKAGDRSST
ncbi:MAG: XRE family transcriptional regulator [Acidimicrobiia bacterium]|nr:MAG: XRE family transcriptional regulator [Acidimicrobiia bacterium]HLU30988.1 helix-turn-helix transcriptional regulator [Acidimicrobiia bacterium]